MIMDSKSDYIHRVNGIPLFYNPSSGGFRTSISPYLLYATPSPPCDFTMTSEITQQSPQSLSPPLIITLTPPLSPSSSTVGSSNNDQSQRRGSVIMKVENCQITPCANDTQTQQISIDHVCRWENCYR